MPKITESLDSEILNSRVVPKQGRAMRRRKQILAVAEDLLDKHDFSEVTTRQIAAEAGIPIGSVYRYFPNKFSIMAAIASETIETVDEKLAALLRSFNEIADWERIIDKSIDIVITVYMDRKGYVNILKAMNHTPELRNLAALYKEEMVKSLTENFIRMGLFSSGQQADSVAHVIVTIYNSMEGKVLLCEDVALQKSLIREWKILVKGYLRHYLESR